jgi:regulator of RNase E activity RraA
MSDSPDSRQLLETLTRVSTASLAGVMLKLGLSNQWVRGPMPIRTDLPRVAGRAFTMRFIPVREDVPGAFATRLPVNRDAVEQMPEGCVAIVDTHGTWDAATFGDIVVARMRQRGVAGIVTDGAVRDRLGLLAIGMPIWSSGITAPPPSAKMLLAAWQQPIGCGGVAVFPDDLVVADADGVVVVPSGLAQLVADKGVVQEQLDAWQLEQVNHGVPLSELRAVPVEQPVEQPMEQPVEQPVEQDVPNP